MNDNKFYNRWGTLDLDGDGLRKYFPFFVNEEWPDLVINHKPIRVFIFWNEVKTLEAIHLKDKKIIFRNKMYYSLHKFRLNLNNI